tara:strand:- start:2466 stop:3737 length:1272 start_codon:yes stop_codon:yes gene_type:complete
MKYEASFDVFKHQNKFIRTRKKFPALVGGYGSGKTVALCLKALLELGRNPNKTILLAEPVYPMVRDVLQPTLEKCLKDVGFNYRYKAGEVMYDISWTGGGGKIILRSAENWRRWAGLNLAGFGIDEACLLKDDSAWRMGISRLRDGHHLTGFTASTPEGFNWHYNYWVGDKKNDYELIQAKSSDNKFLPQEFIDSLYENYDERLILAYLHGQYVNLQHGQTYYGFKREKNVQEVQYNPHLPLHIGMDFNIEPITAVLFQTYNDKPMVRVFDEFQIYHSGKNELLTETLAKQIKERYEKLDLMGKPVLRGAYICYPDPSGKNRHTSAYYSDHDILRKEGFDVRVPRRSPLVIDSVNAVNKAMDFTIIDPKCKNLIKDLEQVVNKEGTRDIDKTNKDLTHLSDGFRYAINYLYPIRKPRATSIMA